jgi:hypothetical protein
MIRWPGHRLSIGEDRTVHAIGLVSAEFGGLLVVSVSATGQSFFDRCPIGGDPPVRIIGLH